MKKTDAPSMYFVGAILRAFDKAEAEGSEVTCSKLWDYVVMECFRQRDGFKIMFQWDTSKAKSKNRIHTIGECIRRGHVPGLTVDDRLRVERT
jgi:hypothetical protein